MNERKERFSIRKLYFGAASVLVGAFIFGGAMNVSAEEVTPTEETIVQEETVTQEETIEQEENEVIVIENDEEQYEEGSYEWYTSRGYVMTGGAATSITRVVELVDEEGNPIVDYSSAYSVYVCPTMGWKNWTTGDYIEVQKNVTMSGYYDIQYPEIEGYEVVGVPVVPEFDGDLSTQTFQVIYRKIAEQTSISRSVYYMDTEGNVLDSVTYDIPVTKNADGEWDIVSDEYYVLPEREFEGYTLVGIPSIKTFDGDISDQGFTVTYEKEEIEQESVVKTVTTHYVNQAGRTIAEDMVQDIVFTRTNGGAWTVTYPESSQKDIEYYTLVSSTVYNLDGQEPQDVEITYTYEYDLEIYMYEDFAVTRTIHFVDEEGNRLGEDVQRFNCGREVRRNTKTGELVYSKWSIYTAGYDEIGDLSVEGYYLLSVDDVPEFDGTNLNVEMTAVFREIETTTTETKTINRTINYVDSNGKAISSPTNVTYTLTRTVTTNNQTGEVTYGEWTTTDSYYTIDTPTIDGYEVSVVPTVAEITADIANQSFDVVYKTTKSQSTFLTTIQNIARRIGNFFQNIFRGFFR